MDFLILRLLSPETGYHFFWVGGWGSKVCAQKDLTEGQVERSLQVGRRRRMTAGNRTADLTDGGRVHFHLTADY